MLERARNVFFSQWEEMLRLRLVVLKSCQHEDIHDLRVASRRFRAALSLLRPLCGGNNAAKLTKDVRALTGTLGTLRNIDEALLFFRSHDERDEMSGFMARLAEMREREERAVIRTLKGFKPGRLDPLVRGMVAGVTMETAQRRNIPPLPSYLSNTSISLFETIHSHLPAALSAGATEERHALRIAIKKWRYFLETVSMILDRDYTAVLERLKKYQSILGSMNDMIVFAGMCREAGLAGDDLDAAEHLLNLENDRLFGELILLVEAEPLSYTFLT